MTQKLETERKFIIEMPSIKLLEEMPEYTRSEILQIYISSPNGITHRIRSRKYKDSCEYTETVKIRVSRISSQESEAQISAERFEELKGSIAEGTSPITKVRHTFKENGYTYEIDIYPEWERSCIMEVELSDEGAKIPFPDIIRIIREVSGIKEYTNASMSRHFPDEEK